MVPLHFKLFTHILHVYAWLCAHVYVCKCMYMYIYVHEYIP